MAAFYSIEQGGVASPTRPVDAGAVADLKVVRRSFTMASQTTSDTLNFTLPSGFRPVLLAIHATATLGSSTLAVGVSGTTGKYRAAAVVTASTIAPVLLGTSVKLSAPEAVLVTIGTASLPASGTVVFEFYGTND